MGNKKNLHNVGKIWVFHCFGYLTVFQKLAILCRLCFDFGMFGKLSWAWHSLFYFCFVFFAKNLIAKFIVYFLILKPSCRKLFFLSRNFFWLTQFWQICTKINWWRYMWKTVRPFPFIWLKLCHIKLCISVISQMQLNMPNFSNSV